IAIRAIRDGAGFAAGRGNRKQSEVVETQRDAANVVVAIAAVASPCKPEVPVWPRDNAYYTEWIIRIIERNGALARDNSTGRHSCNLLPFRTANVGGEPDLTIRPSRDRIDTTRKIVTVCTDLAVWSDPTNLVELVLCKP